MNSPRIWTAGLACWLLIASLSLAQRPPEAQRPAFGARVSRVRVDVIVTDADGRFVDDLSAADFAVFEDGEAQELLSAQLVDLGARTVASVADTAAGGAVRQPLDVATAPAAPPVAASSDKLGAIVFLVDFPGLDRNAKARFAEVFNDLLADTESFGIPRAAYLIDVTGRLRELAPLTMSVDRLRQAGERIAAEPLVRRGLHEKLVAMTSRVDQDLPVVLEDQSTGELARSRATLRLLAQFSDALATRQGRTALVWVTSEVQHMERGPIAALAAARDEEAVLDDGFAADRSRLTGSTAFSFMWPDIETQRLEGELHRAANSANVSIYTIDPLPDHELRTIGSDVRVNSGADATILGSATVQGSLDSLRDPLRKASSETGGQSFIGWSELDEILPLIERDTSRFYLLTYAAPLPDGDGEYHEIRVDVSSPEYEVRARGGYVDLPEEERTQRITTAALSLPGMVTGFPVQAAAYNRWSADGAPIVQMVAASGATDDFRGAVAALVPALLDIYAVAVRDDGAVADEMHEAVQPDATRDDTGNFVYVHDWELRAGTYELRIVMNDAATGRLGAKQIEVEVPRRSDDWSTSDPMLLASTDGNTPQPIFGGVATAGQRVDVYVEVSAGREPVLSGDLFDAAGTTRLTQLPPLVLRRDAAGIHRGSLRLRGLPVGRYSLRVAITDAAADRHANYMLNIEVWARGAARSQR